MRRSSVVGDPDGPTRRATLRAVAPLAVTALAGCTQFLPGQPPGYDYPAGSLVVDSQVDTAATVFVEVVDGPAATLDTTVDRLETVVREEFVTAPEGTAVTLAGRVEDGEPTEFEFYPGGDGETPPQVALFTIGNVEEGVGVWSAGRGH